MTEVLPARLDSLDQPVQPEPQAEYFEIPVPIADKILPLYVQSRPFAGGGFGDIYAAYLPAFQQYYALKAVSESKLRNRYPDDHEFEMKKISSQSELEKEAALVQAIPPHENIVKGYGTILHENQVFAVFEYLHPDKWQNLREARSSGRPFSLQETDTILEQVIAGSNHARLNMTPQRDPTPDNIMVTKQPDKLGKHHIKLIDFGATDLVFETSSILRPQDQRERIGVSTGYIAPELFDNRVYTPQTMVYSLGVIATEMVVGKNVFKGEEDEIWTLEQGLTPVRIDLLLEQRGYPEEVRKVFSIATSELEKRYKTPEEFLQALREISWYPIPIVAQETMVEGFHDNETHQVVFSGTQVLETTPQLSVELRPTAKPQKKDFINRLIARLRKI